MREWPARSIDLRVTEENIHRKASVRSISQLAVQSVLRCDECCAVYYNYRKSSFCLFRHLAYLVTVKSEASVLVVANSCALFCSFLRNSPMIPFPYLCQQVESHIYPPTRAPLLQMLLFCKYISIPFGLWFLGFTVTHQDRLLCDAPRAITFSVLQLTCFDHV